MATRGESPGGEAGRTGIRGPTRAAAAETSVTTGLDAGLHAFIIVSRDRPGLAEYLSRQSVGAHTVILDRRRAERRRVDGSPGLERRRGDRRQPLVREERELWQQAGYCVVFEYARA